jgi:hypothetical protein
MGATRACRAHREWSLRRLHLVLDPTPIGGGGQSFWAHKKGHEPCPESDPRRRNGPVICGEPGVVPRQCGHRSSQVGSYLSCPTTAQIPPMRRRVKELRFVRCLVGMVHRADRHGDHSLGQHTNHRPSRSPGSSVVNSSGAHALMPAPRATNSLVAITSLRLNPGVPTSSPWRSSKCGWPTGATSRMSTDGRWSTLSPRPSISPSDAGRSPGTRLDWSPSPQHPTTRPDPQTTRCSPTPK